MTCRSNIAWFALIAITVILVVVMLGWLGRRPPEPSEGAPSANEIVPVDPLHADLRIALVPERDIFAQRRRHQALADYLARKLSLSVSLITVNTYEAALDELSEGHVNVALLGSMVGVLANDRLGCRVLAKPELSDGVSTYRGVIFVRDDSPIQTIDDLAGKPIAMVRTTTAGNLFPIALFMEKGMLSGPRTPLFRWAGTHDTAIDEVVRDHVAAGAVKDLRLIAYEQANPQVKLRRLATGDAVPNNATFVSATMPAVRADAIRQALLTMDQSPEGRAALEQFGAARFVPCSMAEYETIYRMVERIGDQWPNVGIDGPPPHRPDPIPTP